MLSYIFLKISENPMDRSSKIECSQVKCEPIIKDRVTYAREREREIDESHEWINKEL